MWSTHFLISHIYIFAKVSISTQRNFFHHSSILGSWLSPFSSGPGLNLQKYVCEKKAKKRCKEKGNKRWNIYAICKLTIALLTFLFPQKTPKFQDTRAIRCKIAGINHGHLCRERVFYTQLAKPYWCSRRKQRSQLRLHVFWNYILRPTVFLRFKSFFVRNSVHITERTFWVLWMTKQVCCVDLNHVDNVLILFSSVYGSNVYILRKILIEWKIGLEIKLGSNGEKFWINSQKHLELNSVKWNWNKFNLNCQPRLNWG